jgi:TPR repeat protein
MTIKDLAYSAQQHLQASTGGSFKRAHVYELLAASFGFNSYAALGADTVFTEQSLSSRRASSYGFLVRNRCIEIGYQPDVANAVSIALPVLLSERQIGVIRIADLVAHLRFEAGHQDDYSDDDDEPDDRDDTLDDRWVNSVALVSPILRDGLEGAASKGNALAHYALALIYASGEEDEEQQGVGSDYWHSQAQKGRLLTGVEKEWADDYATNLARSEKHAHHLREAARLGQQDALLELADRFDDPAFFEQAAPHSNADPTVVAEIAQRLGRHGDAKKWLTVAAETGDTEAMRQLIEAYDQRDLLRCWTWVYLAKLMDVDLTMDEHYAINEDGSPYDDDVGGAAYVGGRDGVVIDPLSAEQDAAARDAAQQLLGRIRLAG